jgi:hypothetical protein
MKSTPDRYKTLESPVPPPFRRLRGFSFDPSLATQIETAVFAEVTFKVPWEKLERGPVGDYVEVVDYDPATRCFYTPVDLDDPNVLAQDGLAPDEGNPQFHQQMVYAVVMTTVKNFERALGRWVFWSARELSEEERRLPPDQKYRLEYIRRLRIYPHAMRQANAYYSPSKKALLFGYFPAKREAGGMVFTCLSHDVVAHETTHALLDGMYERYMEPSHPDTRAFHEAFADIVALFQRFSIVDVVRNQIARTRGDIANTANLLGALAQQFGQATGNYGALRDAIGRYNKATGKWEPLIPDPNDYLKVTEEHDRGAILVAAIFDAFLAIYRRRVADLQRIATGGTGILPQGDIHPDLVNRFAGEAAKVARQFCNICIRALDYCPPVDITFGDYLRALITADYDVVPDDVLGYRVAMIEAFRRRGILPEDVRVISEDSLLWDNGRMILEMEERDRAAKGAGHGGDQPPLRTALGGVSGFLRGKFEDLARVDVREDYYVRTQAISADLHRYLDVTLEEVDGRCLNQLTGLVLRPEPGQTKARKFQIHRLHPARRVGPDGGICFQIVISLLQKSTEKLDPDGPDGEDNEFVLRGGCTLIFDLDTLALSYAIRKPLNDPRRLERQRQYLRGEWGMPERAAYFGGRVGDEDEPFALLHENL